MFFSFLPFAVSSEKEGELVFSDEFSEDGAPNSEKWGFEHGFVRNMELQWYTPKNTYCKGGFLVIEARKEKVKNPQFGREPKDYWAYGREYAEYTSSSIVTKNSFDFKKGRLEVRARIPFGKGAWPAIWLLGENIRDKSNFIPWPACGEIDVMEFYRIGACPIFWQTLRGRVPITGPYGTTKKYPFRTSSKKIRIGLPISMYGEWTGTKNRTEFTSTESF